MRKEEEMLHRLGATLFLLSIIFYFFKYIKKINKKVSLKLHVYTGFLGAGSMVLYSIIDFMKEQELTILPVGVASLLIIISGTDKCRRKFNRLHLISVILFVISLAYHIIS